MDLGVGGTCPLPLVLSDQDTLLIKVGDCSIKVHVSQTGQPCRYKSHTVFSQQLTYS